MFSRAFPTHRKNHIWFLGRVKHHEDLALLRNAHDSNRLNAMRFQHLPKKEHASRASIYSPRSKESLCGTRLRAAIKQSKRS